MNTVDGSLAVRNRQKRCPQSIRMTVRNQFESLSAIVRIRRYDGDLELHIDCDRLWGGHGSVILILTN